MRFTIGIKPTIIRGSGTLRQAKERVGSSANQCFCYSSFGNGWINSKYVYGYNIEVFKRGKHRHNKHYVIYRYTFPKEIFRLLNVRIKQGSRTFKILKQ
jgi:hypothetical protein